MDRRFSGSSNLFIVSVVYIVLYICLNVFFSAQLFINNEWVKSLDGKTFQSENPANGQVIADVQQAGKADVDRAVQAAKEAFK